MAHIEEGYHRKENFPNALTSLLNPDNQPINNGPKFGKRHIQTAILTLVMFMNFLTRTILTVAIVAMTNPLANPDKSIPTYEWNDKSLVAAAFLWGYLAPQFLAGYISDRYGAKWFLVATSSISACCGLLIPTAAATLGSKGVMLCRLLQGLTQGFLYPCTSSLLGKWIPTSERSRIGTLVFSGAPVGMAASILLTGYISASSYGWPYAYYIFSSAHLISLGFYAYIGCSDPSLHSTISEEERNYIVANLDLEKNRHELGIPFKSIFTSIHFYALMSVNVAFNYTHWTFITETAIYLDKFMNFDLKSNSLLTALPYILEVLVGLVASFVADFLLSRKILRQTNIRKIMNNFGLVIPAISLYFLGKIEATDAKIAVLLIILVSGSQGSGKSGHVANSMDLAPNFSGILMGISNGTSNIFAAIAPVIAQFLITDETNQDQWRILFYIPMCANVVAMIVNTLFTSGEKQPWSQGIRPKSNPNK
ncbi:unnamed protein product [Phyllotreta striolata]|uniref:Major facilitator superfamily (MFS) profile domain-containing protein n=1 Tax=Phyllotreta striolata TaxID=444603 RepID=A0A9N9TX29_PHYSR|nr:unnamed protein product [Phyllotreta striolata]